MTCSGVSAELGAEVGALRRDPGRAGIQVTLRAIAQPSATTVAVPNPNDSATEQRGDHDVPAGAQPAVGAHFDAVPQPVAHENRLRLGEAQSHGEPACLIDESGDAPVPAVVSRDQDVIGVRLRDAGRDSPDAGFRNELHADTRGGIHLLEIVDQLREILDRIDVVMRRR